nr:RICIN domain-containing protein [Clostridium bornimense]
MAISMGLTTLSPVEVFAANDATINLSKKYQTIRGFGGMNHPSWAGDLTESQRNTAFGNGENQLGFSVLRIYVDDNKDNWYKEVATAKSAIAKGAIVFATPWNPPSSMTETFTKDGKKAKRLRHDKYADYAKHLNDFVTYMKNNGVDLYAISIANEPDYGHDWTWWTADEVLNFMKNYAGSINCKVIAPESFSYNKSMSDPILKDSKALANMDILGAHLYGTSYNNFAYPLFEEKGNGKELWMTEVYHPNSSSSADKWPEALEVSYHMNKALTNGFQTYTWWYIRRSYGPMKEDGTISKRGYCMAQFSKFVRPGYIRVGATENPSTNVTVSAYTGDNKAVIVAINKGSSDVNQKFVVNNGNIKKVDRYRTSGNENLAKTSNLKADSNGFWANLPANSVSTFVCDLSSTTGNNNNNNNTSNNDNNTNNNENATLKDGWYYIKNVNAQKYLQVKNNKGKNAQNVELGKGSGAKGQKWYLKNVGNGYVTLKSGLGNYMVDVANGENKNGTNVQIYDGYSGKAQQFTIDTTSSKGVYTIATKSSNGTKVLDAEKKGTADGTNVLQWAYGKDKKNQQWKFEEVK